MRIAICDDHDVTREALKGFCRDFFAGKKLREIEIEEYASGEQYLAAEEADILLLDIEMGQMNGIEVKERLQRQQAEARILFVTSYDEFMEEAYGRNVFGFLKKPLQYEMVFLCEGHVPEKVAIRDYDLCTIFSNLLSNAREACERLQTKEKRIHVLLQEYQGQMFVTIKNPVEWDVDTERLGRYTSKKDGERHGYGLTNVMEAVARYDGEIWFDAGEGMFEVNVKI